METAHSRPDTNRAAVSPGLLPPQFASLISYEATKEECSPQRTGFRFRGRSTVGNYRWRPGCRHRQGGGRPGLTPVKGRRCTRSATETPGP